MSGQRWEGTELGRLLTLDAAGDSRWRSRVSERNMNARTYGGQLLGQAMAAALHDVPPGREVSMMQFLFLQGAMPDEPIEFDVTTLQEGKRFSARHVRARQPSGRTVLDAQVACAASIEAPAHGEPTPAPEFENPEDLPGLEHIAEGLVRNLWRLGGWSMNTKPSIDFRVPDAHRQLAPETMNGSFRYWLRATQRLPADTKLHAASFAYLSDWWLIFASLGLHLRDLGERKLYIASLNHAMWLHRSLQADQWMHVQTTSPSGADGRGLTIGRVHDLQGRHVATLAQQSLMAYAG